METAAHDPTMNGSTPKVRTSDQINQVVRLAWETEISAEEIALALGLPIGVVGQRVVDLQLPCRDHNRRIIAGTVATPMHDLRQAIDKKDEGGAA